MSAQDQGASIGKPGLFLIFAFFYVPFLYSYGLRLVPAVFVDLPSFYWAAYATFVAHESPYREGIFQAAQHQLGQVIFPYIYWPSTLVLFFPLSLVSYDTSKIISLIVNHASYLAFLYLIVFKLFGPLPDSGSGGLKALGLALYSLFYFPVASSILHGQVNLPLLVLLCAAWHAMNRDRPPAWPAALLASAIWLKMIPLLLLPLLVIRRLYRAVAWTVAMVAAVTGLALTLLPHEYWSDWYTQVFARGGYGSNPAGLVSSASPWNQSINGFTSRLFLPNEIIAPLMPSAPAAHLAPLIASAIVLMVTCLVCWRAGSVGGDRPVDEEISIFLLAIYLALPFSWEHHLVLVLPAVLVVLLRMVFAEAGAMQRTVAIVAAFVLAWEFPFDHPIFRQWPAALLVSVKMYAALALWGVLAARLMRAGRPRRIGTESLRA